VNNFGSVNNTGGTITNDGAYTNSCQGTTIGSVGGNNLAVNQRCSIPVITTPNGSSFGTANPVIVGTSDPNALIQLTMSGKLVGHSTANSTGGWSIKTSSLPPGTDLLTAQAIGFNGNSSTSPPVTVNTPRATTTRVNHNGAPISPGAQITLNVTVTDVSSGPASAPQGNVSWSASGGSFSSASCTLIAISSTQSRCSVTFTAPLNAGTITINVNYFSSDISHKSSSGKSSLIVT